MRSPNRQTYYTRSDRARRRRNSEHPHIILASIGTSTPDNTANICGKTSTGPYAVLSFRQRGLDMSLTSSICLLFATQKNNSETQELNKVLHRDWHLPYTNREIGGWAIRQLRNPTQHWHGLTQAHPHLVQLTQHASTAEQQRLVSHSAHRSIHYATRHRGSQKLNLRVELYLADPERILTSLRLDQLDCLVREQQKILKDSGHLLEC